MKEENKNKILIGLGIVFLVITFILLWIKPYYAFAFLVITFILIVFLHGKKGFKFP